MKQRTSRHTFLLEANYLGVYLEEGGTLVDADWNEAQAISLWRLRELVAAAGLEGTRSGTLRPSLSRGTLTLDGGEEPFWVHGLPVLLHRGIEVDLSSYPLSEPPEEQLVASLMVRMVSIGSEEDGDLKDPALLATRGTFRLKPVLSVHVGTTVRTAHTLKTPLLLTVSGAYRGDNRHYRVEVHSVDEAVASRDSEPESASSPSWTATLLWDEENAGIRSRIVGDVKEGAGYIDLESSQGIHQGHLLRLEGDHTRQPAGSERALLSLLPGTFDNLNADFLRSKTLLYRVESVSGPRVFITPFSSKTDKKSDEKIPALRPVDWACSAALFVKCDKDARAITVAKDSRFRWAPGQHIRIGSRQQLCPPSADAEGNDLKVELQDYGDGTCVTAIPVDPGAGVTRGESFSGDGQLVSSGDRLGEAELKDTMSAKQAGPLWFRFEGRSLYDGLKDAVGGMWTLASPSAEEPPLSIVLTADFEERRITHVAEEKGALRLLLDAPLDHPHDPTHRVWPVQQILVRRFSGSASVPVSVGKQDEPEEGTLLTGGLRVSLMLSGDDGHTASEPPPVVPGEGWHFWARETGEMATVYRSPVHDESIHVVPLAEIAMKGGKAPELVRDLRPPRPAEEAAAQTAEARAARRQRAVHVHSILLGFRHLKHHAAEMTALMASPAVSVRVLLAVASEVEMLRAIFADISGLDRTFHQHRKQHARLLKALENDPQGAESWSEVDEHLLWLDRMVWALVARSL